MNMEQESVNANKSENPEEIDWFLDTHNLLNLRHKDMENLEKPITMTENE